jgi:putative ABC transport system permease protein
MSTGPSSPARRAVVRWAWRLFRREWRQQLMVLTLLAVAVAASVAAAAMTVNAVSKANGQLGDANALIHVDAADPRAASLDVAAARARFGDVEVVSHQQVVVPGLSRPLDLRGQDPDGVYSHPTLRLLAGRYPTAADEVALTDRVAALLSAEIGDRVELDRTTRTVVGRVENPDDLNDEFALVAPGRDQHATSLVLLLHTDDRPGRSSTAGSTDPRRLEVETFGTDGDAVAALLLVAITLTMALVGLIATAGFVVVAQRRQRQLGLLAAIGATERHLRLVMVANGAIVGLTAAVVGAVVGVGGWIVAAPAVEEAAAHRIDRFDLPWALIAASMAIAVVMATAAAWWPARTIARVPVISALSGRPARSTPVHRSLAVAAALVGAGVVGIAMARPVGDHVRPLLLVAGMVGVILGVVFVAPAAVRVIAAPAARLPLAARLALRDLVRYQARAAAALAAVTLALGIGVTVVVLAQSNAHHEGQSNLSDRQLVISIGTAPTTPVGGLSTADTARLDAQAARVAAALPGSSLFTLDVAMNPSTASQRGPREPVSVALPIDNGFRGLGYPYVATPQLLQRYGIDVPTSDDTTELLTSLPGHVLLLDPAAPPPRGASPTSNVVRRTELPSYSSAPRSLITPGAMRRHGWVPVRAGWLVESSAPLTTAQVAAARNLAADAGLTIEVRDAHDDLARVRNIATTVGALLALAIVAMTIGLIRGESAGDLRTLTATGAAPRTRRAITATTAGALALLGVVLGTAGAYGALIAAYHADLGRLAPLPITNLLQLVIGLPLVAAAAGWLLAGREPARFARQPLD